MPEVNLIDFFSYFKGTPEQKEAVQLLQQSMPASLLTNKAAWVQQYRAKPAAPEFSLNPGSPFSTKLTENFTYSEFTNGGDEARRFFNQGQCDVAVEIAQFLQKARETWGPLKITSGHRPPAINAAVGGASQSEHLYQPGCGAVDAYPIEGKGQEFENWCDKQWPYSIGYGMQYRGFVHIGIRAGKPRVRWDY